MAVSTTSSSDKSQPFVIKHWWVAGCAWGLSTLVNVICKSGGTCFYYLQLRYMIKATNVVTSLRLRSSADIVKEKSKYQKISKTPCDRHPAQSFRFYIVLFRCDSPHRGSVGTVIQSSPLIRPRPLAHNGESVFAKLAN
jgi:hypothetical protein